MAELADALVSGTSGRKFVQVQVLFSAPQRRKFELQTTASIFQEGRCGSQNSPITRKRPEGLKPLGLFCYQFFAAYLFIEYYTSADVIICP